MKFVYALILSALASTAVAQTGSADSQTPDKLTFAPEHPQAGHTLTITFQSLKKAFVGRNTIPGSFYTMDAHDRVAAYDITFAGHASNWTATFTPADSIVAVGASVSDSDGSTFLPRASILYGQDGEPIPAGYDALSMVYGSFSRRFMGMEPDKGKAADCQKRYYDWKKDHLENFADKLRYQDYLKDTAAMLALCATLPVDSTATDVDYHNAIFYASRFHNQPLADLIMNIRKSHFPNGLWREDDFDNRFEEAPDAEKRAEILAEYAKAYPGEGRHQPNGLYVRFFASMIASGYIEKGDLQQSEKFIDDNFQGMDEAAEWNDLAWAVAVTGQHLPEVAALSVASLDTVEAYETSLAGKPDRITPTAYRKQLVIQHGMFADTYAFILSKLGSYQEALSYERYALSTHLDDKGAYERYCAYLEKTTRRSKVLAKIKEYILAGEADSAMQAQYVRLYRGRGNGADALDHLLTELRFRQEAEMAKTIMSEPASGFALTDLSGNHVSLASLKGKTVVLDFWATWCGPCKASFPAMQEVVNKHKADTNVAVLFVDTWETVPDKKKNATDFIRSSPYTFHVLLDDDNKVVQSYKVDGIPTKFVIDKNGVLRFKAVGYDGDKDETVSEVENMIQVASKD